MIKAAWRIPLFGLTLAVAACAGGPRPEVAEPGNAVDRVLDEALAKGAWEDLRIDAECRDDAGSLRSARIYGNGVGLWNRQRQFQVPPGRIAALLEAFRSAGFGALRESYGGKDDPVDPASSAAVELICRVRLALAGVDKEVHQLDRGRQSPELRRLADTVLALAEELGPAGLGAETLSEGLDKIARGELAPEALELQVVRQSERPGASSDGWTLRLEGTAAEVEDLGAPEDSARTLRLSREGAAEIARQLAAAGIEDLPVNLWAPEYTDLSVRVLNHRRTLQARGFAGMTAETHGEKQRRFDRLLEQLDQLHRRVMTDAPQL